jgi:hypothetical protein
MRHLLVIRSEHVLEDHALGVEEGTIQGDGMAHHVQPGATVVVVKRRTTFSSLS